MDLGINFKKSPMHDVCRHSCRSTRRATIPFALANYICPNDTCKHLQWVLETLRKFFEGPQSQVSRFQKLYFWGYSMKKGSGRVKNRKNHHCLTFATVAIDLSVVRPPRLLWRTTFVLVMLLTTYNGSWKCLEKFLRPLKARRVVFKNSIFEDIRWKRALGG